MVKPLLHFLVGRFLGNPLGQSTAADVAIGVAEAGQFRVVGDPELEGEVGLVHDLEGRVERLFDRRRSFFAIAQPGPLRPDVVGIDAPVLGQPVERVDVNLVRRIQHIVPAMVNPRIVARHPSAWPM